MPRQTALRHNKYKTFRSPFSDTRTILFPYAMLVSMPLYGPDSISVHDGSLPPHGDIIPVFFSAGTASPSHIGFYAIFQHQMYDTVIMLTIIADAGIIIILRCGCYRVGFFWRIEFRNTF